MTPNEAIKIVNQRTKDGTWLEGRHNFLDEVLVAEILRLKEQRDCLWRELAPLIPQFAPLPDIIVLILDEIEGRDLATPAA